MSFVFKVVSRNPPTALFVIGAFLIVTGSFSGMPNLANIGIWCIILGVVLQVLWLFCVKRGRF